MFKDYVKATGRLTIEVFGENGQLKEFREINNLVVAVGRYYIAQRMISTGPNSAPTAMSHMALGSSGSAPASGDTALGSELGRVGLTSGSGTVAANSNSVVYSASFPAGTATGVVREAAIFNAATLGTMLARTTFADVNKAAGDSIAITWTVSIN